MTWVADDLLIYKQSKIFTGKEIKNRLPTLEGGFEIS